MPGLPLGREHNLPPSGKKKIQAVVNEQAEDALAGSL
jgi:hypothetical protein